MKSKLFKSDSNGWTAETVFENVAGGMGLEVRTVKRSGGVLATTCHAFTPNGDFRTFDVLGGYRETLVEEKARATHNSVDAQHAIALEKLTSTGFHNMIAFYSKPLAA